MNNPVNMLDPSGFATYVLNDGAESDDGIYDNKRYAINKDIIISYTKPLGDDEYGPPIIDWSSLQQDEKCYLIPDIQTALNMTTGNDALYSSLQESENGGVGNANTFLFGGRVSGTHGQEPVENAAKLANEIGLSPSFYAHDHPAGTDYRPTMKNDYTAIGKLNSTYHFQIEYGMVFGQNLSGKVVTFFRASGESSLVTIPLNSFKGIK